MTQSAIVCTWDFTIFDDTQENIVKLCTKHCKKWCFQEEEGEETGKKHHQGRVSFKTKKRLTALKKIHGTAHWSPTSTANRDNNFYVTKVETRTAGPWQDKELEDPDYIPRQVREMVTLYPWQKTIIDLASVWNTRTINVIVDKKGNTGKTSLMMYMQAHKLAKKVPFVNCHKDLMRMVYCVGVSRCYCIDMPRAINKDQLCGLYAAIEEVKSGYCYDDRYTFKQRLFDCPNIWLFTNKDPDLNLLSRDRWKLWKINASTQTLDVYEMENEFLMD